MTMLIDDRSPPPHEGDRAPVEPNWRVWSWIAVAAVVGFAAFHADGLVGYLLLCATVAAVCKAAASAVDFVGGMHDWRQ